MEIVILYLEPDELKMVYRTCTHYYNHLRSKEVVDVLSLTYGIKSISWWDFIFLFSCKVSTSPLYRSSEDANVLEASLGKSFRFNTTDAVLAALESNNTHCTIPDYDYVYSIYHNDVPITKRSNFVYYARSFDRILDYITGDIDWESVFTARVYRNDLKGIEYVLSNHYYMPDEVKWNAPYGRCTVDTVKKLLTNSELNECASDMLFSAVEYKNRELIVHLTTNYREDTDLDGVLGSAIKTLDIDLMYFVLELIDGREIDWKTVTSHVGTVPAGWKILFSLPGFSYNESLIRAIHSDGDEHTRQILLLIPSRVVREWDLDKVMKLYGSNHVREAVRRWKRILA